MIGFELYLRRNAKKFDDYLATFFSDGTHADMRRYLYGPLCRSTPRMPASAIARSSACWRARRSVAIPRRRRAAAAAIEHFHTAALIHDDIEDASETRRGEPCLHIREGLGLAINAGRPRAFARHRHRR